MIWFQGYEQKNYDEKKNWVSNFQTCISQEKGFFPQGEKDSIAQGRRSVEKFDLKFF